MSWLGRTIRHMANVLCENTQALVDELLAPWQEATKTEDARALIARSIIDALLDLKGFATEFESIKEPAKTAK